MYMRVNTGRFAPSSADRIDEMLTDSEMQLAPVLKRLEGIRSYRTGIDRAAGTMIAISLWDDAKQTDAMNGLPEMNALRDPLQRSGRYVRQGLYLPGALGSLGAIPRTPLSG
ncbi:MAG: hypothetical protein FJ312_00030 [SAR202 cluster bacterium]|nr:hypothetical protein [SAR202 cluster bacterium]